MNFEDEISLRRVDCNTPHLEDALRANLGLKVGIILFYQELKVDFLLG